MCAIVEKRLPNRKRYGYMFLIEVGEFRYLTPVGKNILYQGKLYTARQEEGHKSIEQFRHNSLVSRNSFHVMKSLESMKCIRNNGWADVNAIVLVEIPEEAIVYNGWNYKTCIGLNGRIVYLTSQMKILGHIYKQDPETGKWKKVNTKKEILKRTKQI